MCEEALSRIKENKSSLYPTILGGTLTDISKCAQIVMLLHSNRIAKFYNKKKKSITYYNAQFDVGSSKVNRMHLR
jgi:predicted ATPase